MSAAIKYSSSLLFSIFTYSICKDSFVRNFLPVVRVQQQHTFDVVVFTDQSLMCILPLHLIDKLPE